MAIQCKVHTRIVDNGSYQELFFLDEYTSKWLSVAQPVLQFGKNSGAYVGPLRDVGVAMTNSYAPIMPFDGTIRWIALTFTVTSTMPPLPLTDVDLVVYAGGSPIWTQSIDGTGFVRKYTADADFSQGDTLSVSIDATSGSPTGPNFPTANLGICWRTT